MLPDNNNQYVSRAAYKLESVATVFKLDFKNKTVLDVGSSTGGFSDYALQHGASRVIAVEKGTNQMDQFLRLNPKIELHEKTDIRAFKTSLLIDLALIDVSFVSLKDILPSVAKLVGPSGLIAAMAKPQFETRDTAKKHKGVIKNEHMRRELLKELELWMKQRFVIKAKADSQISGVKGNLERFYLLKVTKTA